MLLQNLIKKLIMRILNILKAAVLGVLALQGGAQAQTPLEDQTHAVALPKFQGDLAASGFRCTDHNVLPWRDEFHRGGTGYIDGIRETDLQQPVQCGIDRWERPFIAFKYFCTKVKDGIQTVTRGAAAFFQRYTGVPEVIVRGGHFMPEGCENFGDMDPITSRGFTEPFKKFLQGEPVPIDSWDPSTQKTIQLCDEQHCPAPVPQIADRPHTEL
jgi:hypothetical protein